MATNELGKHTRNPGFEAGNHWVVCDRCGSDVRSKDSRRTWDGLVVCPEDWEQRHPQDFVRGRTDDMSAKGNVRPEPQDNFVEKTYITNPGDNTIPPGTFNNGL